MSVDDFASLIVAVVIALVAWLGKRKEKAQGEGRPDSGAPLPEADEDPSAETGTEFPPRRPRAPRRIPHPVPVPVPAPSPPRPSRRPSLAPAGEAPRTLEASRPKHLVSTRRGRVDTALSDFESGRNLLTERTTTPPAPSPGRARADASAEAGASAGLPSRALATAEDLGAAVVWREVLGPPRALAPRGGPVSRRG